VVRRRAPILGAVTALAVLAAALLLSQGQSTDRSSGQAPAANGAQAPRSGSHCFSSPHLCGYPDPTNTGLPAGTSLTPSGSITASAPGRTISGRDVTGTIDVTANNVTIEDTRVTQTGTCGTVNTCGNYAIRIDEGVTGTVIRDVETRSQAGDTCEHDIRNTGGPRLRIVRAFLHACDSNLYGGGTIKDSYGIAKLAIADDHVENVYFDDSRFSAVHDTLLNPVGQTAVVFGNSNGGVDTTDCRNRLTVVDSLLAGGGYSIYACAHAARAGTSSARIEGNHFARCGTRQVYEPNGGAHTCAGGADSGGYFPFSGAFGVAAEYFAAATTWKENVWDDDLRTVCPDGSSRRRGAPCGR
jgi:hypothetical protein